MYGNNAYSYPGSASNRFRSMYELFWLFGGARDIPGSAIVRLNSLTSRQHVPQYDSRIA